MQALSPENVLLSLIVVAPGFIAVYTAIILGGLKESLSDGRLLGASITATFIIDPLFFWGYTLFGGEITGPTAAVGLFFEGGFRPERVLILALLSVTIGVVGSLVVAGDFAYVARQRLQRQFDVNSHPHQPWEGSLKTANVVRVITTVDWKDKDAYGRSSSSKNRSQMHRLRKWQERIRTKDAGERNLQFALSEIDRMASALGIPRSVHKVASVIYRRALREDLIRGRSIEGVATSALYAACRKEGIPRSLEEISEVSRVERTEIGRTYRYISQELGLEMRPVDPEKYVPRFCSELELSEEVQTKANEIIEETTEKGLLSSNSPTGYAAAVIYAASLLCNEKRTQREVADVAQVTEVTIRNRYQEQIEAMDNLDIED